MPATPVQYSISGDFPNAKVAPDVLTQEILADPAITTTFLYITTAGDVCDIYFDGVLSAPEKTALDAVVAAHQGVETVVSFIVTAIIVEDEKAITLSTFQELGGLVTNPSSFVENLNELVGRCIGCVRTDGTVEFRVIEAIPGEADRSLNSTPYVQPDTSSAWTIFKFTTDVAPLATEDAVYRLEAKLVGATTADLKFTAMSMLKVVTT